MTEDLSRDERKTLRVFPNWYRSISRTRDFAESECRHPMLFRERTSLPG